MLKLVTALKPPAALKPVTILKPPATLKPVTALKPPTDRTQAASDYPQAQLNLPDPGIGA
ncbi:hypothetical protein [Actinoallomurus acaciae]|uniref:Uncharacterized protein n=1 Tax=Actinoallomurus acaciae TaxID=502577 RepID=A0ABV5YSU4_9ACTN